jgi:hypothetical protein
VNQRDKLMDKKGKEMNKESKLYENSFIISLQFCSSEFLSKNVIYCVFVECGKMNIK